MNMAISFLGKESLGNMHQPDRVVRAQGAQNEPMHNWSNNTSHKVYRHKDKLYLAGDEFTGLYQLRSGSAKASIYSRIGQELVTQFFMPGDLLGTDGFNQNCYKQNIQFLETSSVTYLSLHEVNRQLAQSEQFRRNLLNGMSQSIANEQQMLLNYNCYSGEQRVAQFLLNFSTHFAQKNRHVLVFRLTMARADIASYLGMAIETLSRLLTHLQQNNIISVHNRDIEITDKLGLLQAAGLLDAEHTESDEHVCQ